MHTHKHTGKTRHVLANGFALLNWSKGGGSTARNTAIHQLKAGKKKTASKENMNGNNISFKILKMRTNPLLKGSMRKEIQETRGVRPYG